MKLAGETPAPTRSGKTVMARWPLGYGKRLPTATQPLRRKGPSPGTHTEGLYVGGVALPGDFRPSRPNAERGGLPRRGLRLEAIWMTEGTPSLWTGWSLVPGVRNGGQRLRMHLDIWETTTAGLICWLPFPSAQEPIDYRSYRASPQTRDSP